MFTDAIKAKRAELAYLEKKQAVVERLRRSRVIKCNARSCGLSLRIKDLTYVQTYWYERPWGCVGGDTWHAGEAVFICPFCGHRNRPIQFADWAVLNDDKFSLIKNKFKARVDERMRS